MWSGEYLGSCMQWTWCALAHVIMQRAHKMVNDGHIVKAEGSHVARRVAKSTHAMKPWRGVCAGKTP